MIMEGNKEGYGFIHLFGGIWGAYVKPQIVRNWIYHVPGSRYDTPGTIKALGQPPGVGRRPATSTTTTTRVGYDAAAGAVREGQGRDVDRRRLGLDDHQDGLGAENVGVMPIPPGPERPVDVGRRPLRPVAHLGEDEVRRPRRRVAQLRDHVDAREDAHVRSSSRSRPTGRAKPPTGDPYLAQV